uniref:Uncharacterized protein n=1 Tax=Schistosoma haematobium TaxID=6185 RepID=A0A095B4R2_SCHHA
MKFYFEYCINEYLMNNTSIHSEMMVDKAELQLRGDLENERIWTHEKLLLADNTYIGRSLFAVNQLIRQHQLLIKEVANRTNKMEITIQDADHIITKFQSTFEIVIDDDDCKTIQQSKIRSSEKTMIIQTEDHSIKQIELSTNIGVKYKIPKKILIDLHILMIELRYDLKNLIDRMSKRTERLNIGFQCFTHLDEFAELRNWLQECEDMLLLESRASRDIITAKTELKKHAHIEFRVNTLLANCVRDFITTVSSHFMTCIHTNKLQIQQLNMIGKRFMNGTYGILDDF